MNSLNPEQARAFCDRWLPAWSGNQPERLAAFYSEDCFYADPGVPDGLQGREALLVVRQANKLGFSWSVNVQGKARLAVNGRRPLQEPERCHGR